MKMLLQVNTGQDWHILNRREIAGDEKIIARAYAELDWLRQMWQKNYEPFVTAAFRIVSEETGVWGEPLSQRTFKELRK